ncbi:TraX family protein [Niallia sp. MER 6]|uniref:TraX family protein n=1 Tax=Niallia sp. MER 6 TaxID=2939567 RepID=UPI00345C6BB4
MFSPQKIPGKQHNEILKLIAIISMLIDHIGLIFFPESTFMRILGRIAFPIFAFHIAKGYVHTSSKMNYISRLLIFAAISQIPYMFLLKTYNLNILFTLTLSVILISCIQYKKWYWIILIGFIVIIPKYLQLLSFEYTWYGLIMPVIFYLYADSKNKLVIYQSILTILFIILESEKIIQFFAIFGVLLCLYFPTNKFKIYLNKFFFYWFYPVHLTILFIIFLYF